MIGKHLTVRELRGKTIDCHCHLGISLEAYVCLEYPYAQSLEGLYYRQKVTGVEASVVFPASASLFFDPDGFASGEMRPVPKPLSPTPYAVENEMLMLEVFEFNADLKERFVPFVSVDPGRMVPE